MPHPKKNKISNMNIYKNLNDLYVFSHSTTSLQLSCYDVSCS